ncbi:hypothetical protein MCUN1_001208 [Malassezia cuniculi]|uniref:BTB domain-containing protein n=1 Tax=Malassezia cuniculi TaxID=948313 RepID=A0AAF0ETG2_9BASI|nr:hypothetical protein MCUN1_001208 [Malassezia cuniculi]
MYAESLSSVADSIATNELDGGPPPPPKFASVNHLALDAIAAAIYGAPFADTEFVVPLNRGEQVIYAHSGVIRRACPNLWKRMQASSTITLDSMEVDAVTGPQRPPRAQPVAVETEDDDDEFDDVPDEIDASTIGDETDAASVMTPVPEPSITPQTFIEEPVPQAAIASGASTPRVPRNKSKLRWLIGGRGDADGVAEVIHDPIGTAPVRATPTNTAAPSAAAAADSGRMRRYSKPGTGSAQGSPARPPVVGATRTGVPVDSKVLAGSAPRRRSSKRGAHSRSQRSAVPGSPAGRPRAGVRRFRILGVTPRSMQALVFYFYTSQVHFVSTPHIAPHSDANSLHEEASEQLGDGSKSPASLWPPAFSNKAAFCLGEQLELHDLRLRAYDHLTLNLSPRTVLADLLSPFGDRFAEVQRAHLDFISEHWEEVKTRPDFMPIINNLVHGQYPQSSKSLFQLFSKLSIRP